MTVVLDPACPRDSVYIVNPAQRVHAWESAVDVSVPVSNKTFVNAMTDYRHQMQAQINDSLFIMDEVKTRMGEEELVEAWVKEVLDPPALQSHAWMELGHQRSWRCGGPIVIVFGHTGTECAGCGEIVTLAELAAVTAMRPLAGAVFEVERVSPYLDLVVAKRRLAA